MAFPTTRMRRLRASPALRGLVRETELRADRLVLPLFISETASPREPIEGMPGVERLSISAAVQEAHEAAALGLPAVLLFGVPAEKDAQGSGAWDDDGVVQLATAAIKQALPQLLVITDVCLCEYTDHGHCGVLGNPHHNRFPQPYPHQPDSDPPRVDNDATIELLARTAVSHARAGADIVAPSDMMDGRVGAIRAELDSEGFPTPPSSPTPRSSPRRSTARSARPPARRPPSATAAPTRWTPPTGVKRCARRCST